MGLGSDSYWGKNDDRDYSLKALGLGHYWNYINLLSESLFVSSNVFISDLYSSS